MSNQMSTLKDKDYLTTKEAANILGVTEYTVRKKIRNNEIKAIPGATVREGYKIDKDSLIEYAKENKVNGFCTGSTGLTGPAGIAGSALTPFQIGLVTNPLFAAGVGIYGLLNKIGIIGDDDNDTIKDKKRLYELGIQRIEIEIEGLNLQIKALELEDKTVENEKKILEKKIRINELEQKKKEIEIEQEMDSN